MDWDGMLRAWAREEDVKLRRLQREVDRVCRLILNEDVPEIDLILAERTARATCSELFPHKDDLFELIYESRFKRLREQFRGIRDEG